MNREYIATAMASALEVMSLSEINKNFTPTLLVEYQTEDFFSVKQGNEIW